MNTVSGFNAKFKTEYENRGDLDSFIKYVMSEFLPPVEDYPNAVELIRSTLVRCC